MRIRLMAGTVFSTLTLALGAGSAIAQSAPAPSDEVAADDTGDRSKVTVTATRVEQRTDEVPATVSVITDKTIEDELVTDIKDLMRFEPGVSVRNSPQRFGAALGATGRDRNSGFNIRGLEGNRVLIQTDGIRIPDSYAFGPTVNGRGDYVDLDLLKSVEILRGPASALYGSDGVAGAVSFITRDPDDLVQEGRAFGVRARSAYSSADESVANSLIGATKLGDVSAMLAYTRREASETENMGENATSTSARTTPNPSEFESDAYLAKLVWAPGDMHRFRLTFDRNESVATADVLSGRSATVLQVLAEDTSERTRISFDHKMDFGDAGLFRSAKWAIYTQDSKTRQFTFEDRTPAVDRTRDNFFNNEVWGLSGQTDLAFDTGWARHHVIVGGDYSELEQDGIRSGTVPTPPDVFPTRAFPLTTYTLTGGFVQDQISLLDGTLMVYPALRYDAYELTPRRDALFPAGVTLSSSDDSHISPKLGVVVWPSDWIGAFANFGTGYKAPEPSQVNNGFSNVAQSYTSIPNPNLKPETSESSEIGLRVRNIGLFGAQLNGEVVGFVADYKDFITQLQVSGEFFNPLNPAVFQYVNFSDVSVNGAEAKLHATWDNGFGIRMAASMADGEVRGTPNTALDSIDPAKFVAGLTYDDPSGVFGGQLIATFSDGKQVQDVSAATLFRPPSFSIVDITAYWNITDWAALRAGAFNITDEKYWWWSDVRGTTNASVVKDAFTQPGSNYSVSLTLKY